MPPSRQSEPAAAIDAVDRRILNRIQSDFPAAAAPFAVLAAELGLSEGQLLERVRRMKAEGIIRRIGANFSPDRLGYVSTLCAARVPPEQVDRFAEVVNRHPGVTHNYLRESRFNVWFTFIAPSREEIEVRLAAISRETGVAEILNLPATRVFKIRAKFRV